MSVSILINIAGDFVVGTAVLTSLVATWSLLPRPRRVIARMRGRS